MSKSQALYSQLGGYDEELEGRKYYDYAPRSTVKYYLATILACIFSAGLTFTVTSSFMQAAKASVIPDGVVYPYMPAADHVGFENRNVWAASEKFKGPPRLELDEAWHDLLDGTAITISEEELRKTGVNSTSLRNVNSGGYVVGLGVSHDLHCLKRIKQFIYHEDYYNDWEEVREPLWKHLDHCLESLRQKILCNPDMSVLLLEWKPDNKKTPHSKPAQNAVCTNWDQLHDWMRARAVPIEAMEPYNIS